MRSYFSATMLSVRADERRSIFTASFTPQSYKEKVLNPDFFQQNEQRDLLSDNPALR